MKTRFVACCALLLCGIACLFADPVQSYQSGKACQDREDWYRAIEFYQEALRENPSYNLVYQGLAESFYALGEYEQALDLVRKAQTFRKDDPKLLNLQAFILIGLGKLNDASTIFNQVLVTWPNDISARFGIAEIDISNGRISAASSRYLDALRRNPENRKALLSLALVNRELGNTAIAKDYITKALQFHGDDPQVFYYAAYLSFQDGQAGEAEARVRSALSLRDGYDDARELLATILFSESRYAEVLEICDQRIAANRNSPGAWYLRTLSFEKLGRYEEALKSATAGLQTAPGDEIMRALMEGIIVNRLSLEDSRRGGWASWHVSKARQYELRNFSDQALYEYRRALKINPYDTDSRLSYAKLLLSRGYPSRYVDQLKFVQSLGKSTNAINDAVESYGKLLVNSVANRWKLDTLYLDKAHTTIGLYFMSDPTNLLHADAERITTGMIGEVFSYDLRYGVQASESPVGSYSEAFRKSREKGDDYFGIVSFRENSRDIQIRLDLYVARTGSKAESFTVFRTGNDRYANALRRLVQTISSILPVRGAVLGRYQAEAVVDLGKSDGISRDMKFDVLPAEKVSLKNEGIGLVYDPAQVLGTFTISTMDEDVGEGALAKSGFYDRINPGDVVIPQSAKKDAASAPTAAETSAKQAAPALLSQLRKIL